MLTNAAKKALEQQAQALDKPADAVWLLRAQCAVMSSRQLLEAVLLSVVPGADIEQHELFKQVRSVYADLSVIQQRLQEANSETA